MNIYSFQNKTSKVGGVNKHIFRLKPASSDGLILHLINTHTNKKKCKIRFTQTTFDDDGQLLANADAYGNIFIIDFTHNKYWMLPKFESCSVLKFRPSKSDELFIGLVDGRIFIVNVHLGEITGQLEGHKKAIKNISFANNLCFTATNEAVLIFDLTSKLVSDELVMKNLTLKYAFYIPISDDILMFYNDSFIHIWNRETLEPWKKIHLGSCKNSVKCFAFSKDGHIMVIGGRFPFLLVYLLDKWILTKSMPITPNINNTEMIEFISQPRLGDSDKILAILSSDGCIYFLNIETESIIKKIQSQNEFIISISCQNPYRLSAILCSGEINVYEISNVSKEVKRVGRSKSSLLLKYVPLKEKVTPAFDLNKLYEILKLYGEFPESYRSIIWIKILNLPNNIDTFSTSINRGLNPLYQNLNKVYPLINKSVLNSFKKLLSNLGNWCPIFNFVKFLPLFIFPFIKMFGNEPVVCFEAVCTIILNWSQHWFEYIPFPPINVLAIIENVFAEHDPELLTHLTYSGVTSQVYAWSLLEVAFSEVLTDKEWCILWDHVISNEPSFILFAAVSYNITFRSSLLSLNLPEDFEVFYHSQNLMNLKKFITKTYYLLENTSPENHPRQFLNKFESLKKGVYPNFNDYPKISLDYETRKTKKSIQEKNDLISLASQIKKNNMKEEVNDFELKKKQEEEKRMQELEDYYRKLIIEEKSRTAEQMMHLSKIKHDLSHKESELLETTRKNLEEHNIHDRRRIMRNILLDIKESQDISDFQYEKSAEKLYNRYLELIEQKKKIEKSVYYIKNHRSSVDSNLLKDLTKAQNKSNGGVSRDCVPLALSVLNEELNDMDLQKAKEVAEVTKNLSSEENNLKIAKMKSEIKKLENNIKDICQQLSI